MLRFSLTIPKEHRQYHNQTFYYSLVLLPFFFLFLFSLFCGHLCPPLPKHRRQFFKPPFPRSLSDSWLCRQLPYQLINSFGAVDQLTNKLFGSTTWIHNGDLFYFLLNENRRAPLVASATDNLSEIPSYTQRRSRCEDGRV